EFNGIKKVQLVLEDAEIKDMQLFDMRSKNNQNFSIINKDTDTFFVAEDKEKLGSNYYHYGETIPYNVSQVILRDLPISMNNFETTLKELKPSKDRKSTRLNSSHVSISYAVFCLKKKNMK